MIKYIFTQPLHCKQVATQDQILSGVQLVLNSELFVSQIGYIKVKDPSLPYYLCIPGRRIVSYRY